MEQVLVVERDKLLGGEPLSYGFHKLHLEELLQNIYRSGYFIGRPDAENNPALKQIIPYLLISHKNNITSEHKLFLVQRLSTQTEKRLHNKYSIGIGGHINPAPASKGWVNPVSEQSGSLPIENIINSGLERELHEELKISTPYHYKLVGYLNDDTNPVGQVHFGLVFQVIVNDESGVEVAEKDLMVGRFVTINEVEEYFSLLETWSQLVYKDFIKPIFPLPSQMFPV